MKKNHNRIGIFDSGLGGLTVLKQLQKKMPNEKFIYFGDTAHVPYGNKSVDTIAKRCIEIINFLISKKVKLIIIACNTASSTVYPLIKSITNLPTIDVITPVVKEISNLKNIKNIGVIGTEATIQSNEYQKKIKEINDKINIYSKACPLFVPIIEEGLFNHAIAELSTKMYLKDIINKIDALILGCTHYPIIMQTIKNTINKNTHIIDSSLTTANYVKEYMFKNKMLNVANNQPESNSYYVTDKVVRFNEISNMFLEKEIKNIKKIKL